MRESTTDALSVFDWIVNTQGIPAERIVVAGDSAGGGLSVLVLQKLVERNIRAAAGLLLSPWVDVSGKHSATSFEENSRHDWMTGREPEPWVMQAVQTGFDSAEHPELSPIFGKLEGLPPLLVMVSKTEVIRDQSRAFVEKAVAAGVEAELYMPDVPLPHIWVALSLPEGVEDTAVAAHWLSKRLAPRAPTPAPTPTPTDREQKV